MKDKTSFYELYTYTSDIHITSATIFFYTTHTVHCSVFGTIFPRKKVSSDQLLVGGKAAFYDFYTYTGDTSNASVSTRCVQFFQPKHGKISADCNFLSRRNWTPRLTRIRDSCPLSRNNESDRKVSTQTFYILVGIWESPRRNDDYKHNRFTNTK